MPSPMAMPTRPSGSVTFTATAEAWRLGQEPVDRGLVAGATGPVSSAPATWKRYWP